MNIAATSPSCDLSTSSTLYATKSVKGDSEYVLLIEHGGTIPIRLTKEYFTPGGYLLFLRGVS